jgi:hypothetical protein
MKILGLFFLLFVCLGISSAQNARKASPTEASPKPDSSKAKSSKPQSDLLAAQVADGAEDRLIFNMNMKPDAPDSPDNANTCAYMRTYRVKRQARGSDAVAPAGYTTCVPTRRFEMRSAVETRTDSRDDTRTDSGGDTQKQ